MAKKILKTIFFIFEIVIMIIVAGLFYFSKPVEVESPQLYIPSGSIAKIITQLQRSDVPVTRLDTYMLSLLGRPQSGWIDIKTSRLSRLDFLKSLTTAKAALFKIRIIPGETTYVILRQLSHMGYDLEKLQKSYESLAPYPEGVLFAETYYLPKGIDEERLMRYLIKSGLQRHGRLAQKVYGKFDRKRWFERVVTIASIVQKEAANTEEMPIVASVIYNRLKIGMPLQMDGALNYGSYSHKKITARRIREDSSRFNTYKYKGLPPYPVCVVGIDAIKAALHPAKTDYLYFVKSKDGGHKFSRTYKNHLRNIKDVQK